MTYPVPAWIVEHNRAAGHYGDHAVFQQSLVCSADLTRVLKNVYAHFRLSSFPKLSPLLAQMKKGPSPSRYGGQGVFFDVEIKRSHRVPPGQVYALPGMLVMPGKQYGMITGITE